MANSTIETVGFIPEPHGRGTIGLLWNCFATLFLCTWSAIHPNLPELGASTWSVFWERVGYVVMALAMPELVVSVAILEFNVVRKLSQKAPTWSIKQLFFLRMGGFVIKDISAIEQSWVRPEPERLLEMFSEGLIPRPKLDDTDVEDRSKADWSIKAIAFLQVLSFVTQLLGRAFNNLGLTTLELFTLANVCCGGIMYIAWWNKPFDVRTPIVLEVGGPLLDVKPISRIGLLSGSGGGSTRWILFSCFFLFGGLHVLGWRFHFPSETEKLLWRISSVACTALPLLLGVMEAIDTSGKDTLKENIFFFGTMGPYAVFRLYMFIEMFVGLRSVPVSVYQTPQWSQYFPSLG